MSKAFNCLSQNSILNKLGSLGICGKALQWFTRYLGDWTQIVELGYLSNNEIVKVRSTPLPAQRCATRVGHGTEKSAENHDRSESCKGAFVEWGIMTVVAAYLLEVIISSCSRGLTRNRYTTTTPDSPKTSTFHPTEEHSSRRNHPMPV
ncbi:hypothetical protein J6590_075132 [Homalodisca vitripennis]|nr:hypothetical protein J6590_075132 [Homalodisca vitripennis]